MKIITITVPVLAILLSTICLLPASAGTPSNSCYHYIYTNDYQSNHYSLVKNGSVLIGNDLTIISN